VALARAGLLKRPSRGEQLDDLPYGGTRAKLLETLKQVVSAEHQMVLDARKAARAVASAEDTQRRRAAATSGATSDQVYGTRSTGEPAAKRARLAPVVHDV
jgi:hypothetical protein